MRILLLALAVVGAAACSPKPQIEAPPVTTSAAATPTAAARAHSGEPSAMRQDGALATAEQKAAVKALYLFPAYDVKRDPAADVMLASEKAHAEGKRILLEIGGHWCVWCHLLDNYIAVNDDVRDAFGASFVIVKVNYSDDNENAAFLSQYPKVAGYPHFFVLDADGKFLGSQDTSELEHGRGYEHDKMIAFAAKWRRP